MAGDAEEFVATSFDFFKIILSKNPANENLELPKRFVRLYGQTLSNEVFLKPHCGPEWTIDVLKRNGKVWLRKGWPEFVNHFSIDRGHLLFFRYKGNSYFKVSICDVSTCQIYYPDWGETNGKRKVDDLVQILDNSPADSYTEDSGPPYTPTCKRGKAATGKSDATERERGLEPSNPFFIMVMKPSLVIDRFDFQLPAKFWKKHLNSMIGGVLLHVSGAGTWPVKIFVRQVGRPRASFEKTGWEDFVEDNELKVGDTCTFELINEDNEVSFKVFISRAAGASSSQPFQATGKVERPNMGAKIFQRRPTCKFHKKTRAFAEASKFSSANPFFRAFIAQGQNYSLRVPRAFGRSYFENNFEKKTHILTLKAEKRSWTVTLLACAAGYVLCKGYFRFVKDNSLRPGDVCVFELIKSNEAVLKVSVFRNTV